ncbi:hypothetical protein D3C81_1390170 [compost metagenome]
MRHGHPLAVARSAHASHGKVCCATAIPIPHQARNDAAWPGIQASRSSGRHPARSVAPRHWTRCVAAPGRRKSAACGLRRTGRHVPVNDRRPPPLPRNAHQCSAVRRRECVDSCRAKAKSCGRNSRIAGDIAPVSARPIRRVDRTPVFLQVPAGRCRWPAFGIAGTPGASSTSDCLSAGSASRPFRHGPDADGWRSPESEEPRLTHLPATAARGRLFDRRKYRCRPARCPLHRPGARR